MGRPRQLVILTFLLSAIVAACGSQASSTGGPVSPAASDASPANGSASAQRSEGGQVTVEARWFGPSAGPSFDIKLDTHSVDLDSLDLSNALLRNDRGETLTAEPWTAAKGGHHREGTLTFVGDPSTFFAGATSIELVLTGVGGVPERTLRWQIGS
jgi:hypothetical protein